MNRDSRARLHMGCGESLRARVPETDTKAPVRTRKKKIVKVGKAQTHTRNGRGQ